MWDLSSVFDLYHSSQQRRTLNPLSMARDRTCVLMDPSQVFYRWAMTRTPYTWNILSQCSSKGTLQTPCIKITGSNYLKGGSLRPGQVLKTLKFENFCFRLAEVLVEWLSPPKRNRGAWEDNEGTWDLESGGQQGKLAIHLPVEKN